MTKTMDKIVELIAMSSFLTEHANHPPVCQHVKMNLTWHMPLRIAVRNAFSPGPIKSCVNKRYTYKAETPLQPKKITINNRQ